MTQSESTLDTLAADLAAGRVTSLSLTNDCLARIEAEGGNGGNAYISVDANSARAAAQAMDSLRAAHAAPSPFAGIPISIKDLFDIAGQVTTAGSRVLAGAAPATSDAVTVARLRRAGLVVLGRVNMTEFAYSGLGLNPHYGTPLNPWDRQTGRAPGGSSSGGAVSVACSMAHGTLGTDTGGSCRIPAAFCGLVGYKPTASRIPTTGALPLSFSLDSMGTMARSVRCCATMDSMLAAEDLTAPATVPVKGLRFAVPTTVVLDTLDTEVAQGFERALRLLSKAGALIEEMPFPEFDDIARLNAKVTFTAAESYAWHRHYIETQRAQYDPRVVGRIERGAKQTAADYVDLVTGRAVLIRTANAHAAPYDGLLMPTVATIAPRMTDLIDDGEYSRANLLALRNATVINMIDGCALSLPMHERGSAPVGLMLCGTQNQDKHILAIGCAVEGLLNQNR